MIRTLHLIDGLGTGGAERSLAELLPELPPRGIEPTVVVAHRRDEGVQDQVEAAGVRVVHVPGRYPQRVRQVRALIAELGTDLVHSTITPSNHVARAACIGGPPLLTSLVNMPFSEGRRSAGNVAPWKLEVVRLAERATAPTLTDHFHALTRAVADHAVRTTGLDPAAITTIPRGRNRDRLGAPSSARRRAVRAGLGIPDDAPVVLSVGRREPQKAQWVLLEAVARLRDRVPGLVCLIAGRDGSAARRLDELAARHELDGTVRFLGHRDDVPDLLVAADVFAFPSLYEGLGGAVLEAMAMHTPVVASDIPAVREVLDDGRAGALVPVSDAAALADALAAVLDAAPTATVDHAARRFDEVYDHDVVTTAMAGLFLDVAARGR